MPVTIKDIARYCNVSSVTVSNALNGTGRMSGEKRAEILRKADELGYIPNRNARNLVKGVKGRVGLFVPDVDYLKGSAFFNLFLAGVLSVFSGGSYDLVVALNNFEGKEIFSNLLNVDGAIFFHPQLNDSFYEMLKHLRVPFLIVGRPQAEYEREIHYVDVDNVATAYNTTKFLLKAGHIHNLFILGKEYLTITEDHLKGIRMLYEEYGMELDESHILFMNYGVEENFEEVKERLQRYPNVTGIVTDSDTQALKVIHYLQKKSLKIPDDFSVVCCCGTYQTELCNPSITGATSPSHQLGVEAAHRIEDIIDRKIIQPLHVIVDYSIFWGESVAVPRKHSCFDR